MAEKKASLHQIVLHLSSLFYNQALYLNNLLERDECSKDELEVCSNPAIPSIFTEACTNGNYIEVGRLVCVLFCQALSVKTVTFLEPTITF